MKLYMQKKSKENKLYRNYKVGRLRAILSYIQQEKDPESELYKTIDKINTKINQMRYVTKRIKSCVEQCC